MRNFVLLVCVHLSYNLCAQQATESAGLMRTDLISPSPTAANLGKYGEIPVTYYTGIPNVSIPIFNIAGNELSIPISLTYNFNGLQPSQKSSWVGLGWSLQAGGVITRTLGDKPDTGDGYNRDSASFINQSQSYFKRSYEYAAFDNLPDIFSFNFGNYTGKFILFDGEAHVMPDQKLKVELGGAGFIITTEDGTVYEFGEPEEIYLRGSSGSPFTFSHYTSTWHLVKITNSTNTESIKLYYDSDGMVTQYGQMTQSYDEFLSTDYVSGYSREEPKYPSPLGQVFPTKVSTKRLSKIASNKYIVHFDAGEIREDIEMASGSTESSRTLGSIRIYSGDGGPVKRLHFNYGYLGAPHGTGGVFLKLASIVEDAFDSGSVLMKYQFEYFNENGSFGSGLISKVDKYGYNKDSGPIGNMIISNKIYQFGVDREPDFDDAVTGALKKVVYPTGGATSFIYEANRYYDGDKYNSITRYSGGQDYTSNHSIRDGYFELFSDTEVEVTIIRTPLNPAEPQLPHNNSDEFEIWDMVVNAQGIEVPGSVLVHGALLISDNNIGHRTIFLEAGKYMIRALCDIRESQVDVAIKWELITGPHPGELGPGIRLKELTHDNGEGSILKKSFSFVDTNGFSSGKLLQNNTYGSREFTHYYHDFENGNSEATPSCVNVFLRHTSMIAETNGVGLPLYYRRVVEETTSGTVTHRTDYNYEYFHGTKSVELLEKNEYTQSGDTFIVQSKLSNTFSNEYQGEIFGGMNVYARGIRTYGSGEPINVYDGELKVEAVSWKHPDKNIQTQYENGKVLTIETKSFYDVSGTRNLTATKTIMSDGSTLFKKYKYPEDYSGVFSASELVSIHMLSPVIEEQVWRENATGDSSVMISGQINVYSGGRLHEIYVLESLSGITKLSSENKTGDKYTTLISDSRYKKKITFSYDASGRMITQQLTDHPVVSYLWGHEALSLSGSPVPGKVYPIAEIKNANSNQVFHTSFEDATGTTMLSVTGNKAFSGQFLIPGSFTGSYSLTYWKKTGTGMWKLIQEPLYSPSGYLIGDANSFIDEVRLHPSNAVMTTYSYKPEYGISTANDANNEISYYEYDIMGRLKLIRDKSGSIIKAYDYHTKDEIRGILIE